MTRKFMSVFRIDMIEIYQYVLEYDRSMPHDTFSIKYDCSPSCHAQNPFNKTFLVAMSIWLGPVSGNAFRAAYAIQLAHTLFMKPVNQLTFNDAFAAGDKNAPRIVPITSLTSDIPAIRLPIAFVIGAFPIAITAFMNMFEMKFRVLSSHLQTPLIHAMEDSVLLFLGFFGHVQSDNFLHILRLGSILPFQNGERAYKWDNWWQVLFKQL